MVVWDGMSPANTNSVIDIVGRVYILKGGEHDEFWELPEEQTMIKWQNSWRWQNCYAVQQVLCRELKDS